MSSSNILPATRVVKEGREMQLNEYLTKVESMGKPEFLMEDLLTPKRYLLFPGRTGIGKSLLATQLTLCFASGQPWVGFKVKPCICLYVNLELPDYELGQRLKLQSAHYKLIHEPKVESRPFVSMPLETANGLAELEAIITIEPRPEVIIIDSFRQVYGGRINDNDQVARWVSNAYHLMDKYSLGIFIVQNTGKARPFLDIGSTEEAIGAMELANRASTVMVATAKQQRAERGQFGTKASDEVELHIPKYGVSTKALETINLKFNRSTLLFERPAFQYELV